MKFRTLEDLHKHAIANGAEVVVDGRRFNADRVQFKPLPKPPVQPVIPEPVVLPQELTREQVQEMFAARDEAWARQLSTVIEMLKTAISASVPKIEKEELEPEPVKHWEFTVTYDRDGAIMTVAADAQ